MMQRLALGILALSLACARTATSTSDAGPNGADVRLGETGGNVASSGGTTRVPETAGAGGRGSTANATGGALGGARATPTSTLPDRTRGARPSLARRPTLLT